MEGNIVSRYTEISNESGLIAKIQYDRESKHILIPIPFYSSDSANFIYAAISKDVLKEAFEDIMEEERKNTLGDE